MVMIVGKGMSFFKQLPLVAAIAAMSAEHE